MRNSNNSKDSTKKIKAKYKQLFNIILLSLTVGFIAGISVNPENIKTISSFTDSSNKESHSLLENDPVLVGSSEIDLCFTPPSGCSLVIANHISKVKESIYVQAYGITSSEIVNQLILAHSRGVKVRVLLDKSNLTDKYSKMQEMIDKGIEVSIDKVSGIAHNKVMIIDQSKVITGSFNFTKSADTRNTENIIIVNDKAVATRYLQNWLSRKAKNDALQAGKPANQYIRGENAK